MKEASLVHMDEDWWQRGSDGKGQRMVLPPAGSLHEITKHGNGGAKRNRRDGAA